MNSAVRKDDAAEVSGTAQETKRASDAGVLSAGIALNLLQRSEVFLMDHIPISGRVVPGKMIREDYPLYPSLATREAVANAVCHRDYTAHGGAVAIAMYDDRLKIINPGILHFDKAWPKD